MSKHVRIENADTSDHKLVVETWVRSEGKEPTLLKEEFLNSPTSMITGLVHQSQYLVIREHQ